MKIFWLYYYTNNFEVRKFTYIRARNIDEAWDKAKQLYGNNNLESMCEKWD